MHKRTIPADMFDESLIVDPNPTIEYEDNIARIISPSSGTQKSDLNKKFRQFEDFTFNMKQKRFESQDEIKKWESSPVRIHAHRFNQ